jgi:hypothetical protein
MSLSRPPVSAALLDMGDAGDHAVPSVRIPLAGTPLTVRWVEATATCSACAWAASMTGDRGDDVRSLFARALAGARPRVASEDPMSKRETLLDKAITAIEAKLVALELAREELLAQRHAADLAVAKRPPLKRVSTP